MIFASTGIEYEVDEANVSESNNVIPPLETVDQDVSKSVDDALVRT
jgi:hypothetical protein